jgi:hypothetical protein
VTNTMKVNRNYAFLSLPAYSSRCSSHSIETTRQAIVTILVNRWHRDQFTKRIVCHPDDRWCEGYIGKEYRLWQRRNGSFNISLTTFSKNKRKIGADNAALRFSSCSGEKSLKRN